MRSEISDSSSSRGGSVGLMESLHTRSEILSVSVEDDTDDLSDKTSNNETRDSLLCVESGVSFVGS